jgi:hypothetical protein
MEKNITYSPAVELNDPFIDCCVFYLHNFKVGDCHYFFYRWTDSPDVCAKFIVRRKTATAQNQPVLN